MGDNTHFTTNGTVTQIDSYSGQLNVPAQAQRELGICIDDPLEVTLSDLSHKYIDSVTFQNRQVGGDSITVPSELMREAGIEDGDVVEATFSVVDEDEYVREETEESLADSPGSTDDGDSTVEELVEDLTDDEAETEDEGLGELFG